MRLLILPLLVTSVIGSMFSNDQKIILQEAYSIGKQVKVKNMSFENTLRSIAFTESSAGRYIIGDEHITKDLKKASLGVYQVRLETAKEVIKKDPFMNKYFKYLLKDDRALVSMLLSKSKFGALVAVSYLKMNYKTALRRGHHTPWEYTVSRYNGGSKNYIYINKIRKNMKLLKREL